MIPELTNAIAYAAGADKPQLQCRAKTIESMQRHINIKTGMGVSTARNPRESRCGEPVGTYQQQLLTAHQLLYKGIHLQSVHGGKGISKNNDAYVDDVDTWAGSSEYGPDITDYVMSTLENRAQKWTNVQDVAAVSTAFHKCTAQILAWKIVRSSLQIDYEYTYELCLVDSNGATTKIPLLTADKANVGLGFNLTPDGAKLHKFKARWAKTLNMCKAAMSLCLNQYDAYNMLTR
ncbi:hypothetical protein ACHAXR_004900 [Thalassiosira sp. AJA248-18]